MATYTLAEAKLRTTFEVGDIINVAYTGAPQDITFPTEISKVKLECLGAEGEWHFGYGGSGGYSVGEYTLQYKTLNLYVGGGGATGGWNGGGGGGGGGATDVRVGGTALTNRIIVAGGGGRGGGYNDSSGSEYVPGGHGGGLVGGASARSDWYSASGKGGTQTEGGTPAPYGGGTSGTLGLGGSPGGGGGYYGGGAGGSDDSSYYPAGGGSGYIGGVTNATTTAGAGANANAHGSMIITILEVITVTPVVSNYLPTANTIVNPFIANGFKFKYTETEEAKALEKYTVFYKETSASTWSSTGWITNTSASGSTITHSFPANTFTADKNYEWYAVCQVDGVDSETPATKATFNTLLKPSAVTVSPKNSIKVSPLTTTRLGWTYTDPLSSTQSAYEVFYKPVGGVEVSTGKITSANAYHDIAVKGLAYTNDPTYEWRVVVWNTQDIVSSSSDIAKFIYLLPYEPSGTYTSEAISVPRGLEIPPITVSYTATTPTGTTLTVKVRTSEDTVTWSAWVNLTTPLELTGTFAYLQYEVTTTTTDMFITPEFKEFKISYVDQYYAQGTWTSPILDINHMDASAEFFETIETLNSGTVTYEFRNRPDPQAVWSSWTNTLTPEGQFQIRAIITPNPARSTTPVIEKISGHIDPDSKRSAWISQPVDVAQASDLNQSYLKGTIDLHTSGLIILYSRSKMLLTDDWSDWETALEDGTLMHPPASFIQVMAVIYNDTEIKELTLTLDDAESGVEVIKTGLTPKASYDFAILGNKSIIVNGNDHSMMWNAVDPPEPLGDTPPVLSMVTTHHNRLWGVDRAVTSRVRFSNILDPTKWDAFDFMDFNPDDGDQITALIRYGQNLLVSKLRSMALLTGNRAANYNISWLDSEAGASGKNAICVADKYIVYVSQDGIRFTDLAQSVIASERLLPSWERISKRRLNQAACVYWKNKVYIALPSEKSLYNDTVWVYDFLRNSWSILEGWAVSNWRIFNQYGEDILLAGSSQTGQVHLVDVTEYDDAIPVEFEWRSKDFHFNHPEKYKLFRNVFIDIEGVAETTELEVDLIVDGEVTGTYKTEIPAGAGVKTTRRILPPLYGAVLGSAISLQVRGRCGIQSITIEYALRGNIPGGDY